MVVLDLHLQVLFRDGAFSFFQPKYEDADTHLYTYTCISKIDKMFVTASLGYMEIKL